MTLNPKTPMQTRNLSLLAMTLAAFLAAPAVAQTLTVDPAVLTQGANAAVTYTNTALANTTVVVDVSDGNGHTAQIEIAINSEGVGRKKWAVPNWDTAIFSAPGVSDVFCPVVPG